MTEPEIIYEDVNFLAVNKPAGLIVHGTRNMKHETKNVSSFKFSARGRPASGGQVSGEKTLVEWLLKRYPEIRSVGDDPAVRPGIVHRLDRETSGVLLAARNQGCFAYLKSLFEKRRIAKTYLLLAFGIPKAERGTIDAPIGMRSGTLKRSTHSETMAKRAVTRYRLVGRFAAGDGKTFSLLEAAPETGRTHQIRVHMASVGHPVVGDRLYGPKKQPNWATRCMLHAVSLEFSTADGKRLKVEADPPPDFTAALSRLRQLPRQ